MTTETLPAAAEDPKPFMAGSFAIFRLPPPDGRVLMVVHCEGETEPRKTFIPKMVVDMLSGGGGPLGAMMRKAFAGEQPT